MTKSPKVFDVDATIEEYLRLIKSRWGARPLSAKLAIDRRLARLRARWRAWNGDDDLHETAMRCWDGEDVNE